MAETLKDRSATSSIEGFYYQFLTTVDLCVDLLLNGKTDTTIICEGDEDIDYTDADGKTHIQVKSTKKRINLRNPDFFESIFHFLEIHQTNPSAKFVFYTQAAPGREQLDGTLVATIGSWIEQQGLWTDNKVQQDIITRLGNVLTAEAKTQERQSLIASLTPDFIKSVFLSFETARTFDKETSILDKLRGAYSSKGTYHKFLYLNILHLVIRKSCEKQILDRKIGKADLETISKRTQEELITTASSIVLSTEDGDLSLSLIDIRSKLLAISSSVSEIDRRTATNLNENLIEHTELPDGTVASYDEFLFVQKLNNAGIPSRMIEGVKDDYYQMEYAKKRIEYTRVKDADKHLKRLEVHVKGIYLDEHTLALAEGTKPIRLLVGTHKVIKDRHNGQLSSPLPLDSFHKIGLLHHVSNNDDEIIWEVKND